MHLIYTQTTVNLSVLIKELILWSSSDDDYDDFNMLFNNNMVKKRKKHKIQNFIQEVIYNYEYVDVNFRFYMETNVLYGFICSSRRI